MNASRKSEVGSIAAIALVTCGGCATEDAPIAEVAEAAPIVAHAAGGWIEHARSPLVPYCHGVLVAPDVVVTASNCADEGWYELSFGVGDAGDPSIPVAAAMWHPMAGEDPRHALVALVLERPVEGVTPASLEALQAMPCDVELPTYMVTARGTEGDRKIWTACGLEPESESDVPTLVAMEGYPNCHGDSGAGAFVRGARDRVIGWVTTAGRLGPVHPEHEVCVTSVGLATVAANVDFLELARERSRVAAPF
ncbi:trypsin-like serine protease [Sandaracinus amylolyticus]|uniref:trypsin-like serine protease n=1 Tax=Sandaracinus amylolyticus TaxID=927083 RepID=UPI0012ED15A1|nr:trypsin-like serine protease [Sandaracinus amylolyticus]